MTEAKKTLRIKRWKLIKIKLFAANIIINGVSSLLQCVADRRFDNISKWSYFKVYFVMGLSSPKRNNLTDFYHI